jgi:hypothetical protein
VDFLLPTPHALKFPDRAFDVAVSLRADARAGLRLCIRAAACLNGW